MKYKELAMKTQAELEAMVADLRAKLAQLRFDLADRNLKQTSTIRQTRTAIARAMTALRHVRSR